MMVITHIVLADTPAPTPLITGCDTNEPYKTTPLPRHLPSAICQSINVLGLYFESPLAVPLVQLSLAE